MTEREYLQEQVNSNAECLRRVMEVVASQLPSTAGHLAEMSREWNRID